ncbi:diguanylate cyclase [Thiomicrorhabdus sp.]|uniref:diguanylate cyclase n=1 Tax=Thiomicrorhabdus sp. TaxID=2039724 RepID=UPI00356A0662
MRELIKLRSSKLIFVVFLLTLILVSTLVFTAQEITTTTLKNASDVINTQYQKQHNLMNLHIAGQKRTVDIQRILLADDPFEKDAALMSFYEDGKFYTEYRDKLAQLLKNNPLEQEWLDEISSMGKETGPLQNQIADIAMNGDRQTAKQRLLTEGLEKLNRFSDKVNEFSLSQAEEIKKSIAHANHQVDRLMQTIIFLATALIIISMLFSVFLTRRFKHVYRKLKESNDTLDQQVKSRTQELLETQNELLQQNRILEQLSTTDPLTQLSNRLKIEQVLETQYDDFRKTGKMSCLMLIDLDHFKEVNDNYGHHVGDEVLQEFAELLKRSFTDNAHIGRWGGEEFIVILEGVDDDSMIQQAEQLRTEVERHTFPSIPKITISGGIACMQDANGISDLIHKADLALYVSKNKGRNRITRQSPDMLNYPGCC